MAVDDVVLGHVERVCRPLAVQVGQVHRISHRRAPSGPYGLVDAATDVHGPLLERMPLDALAWVRQLRIASSPGLVQHYREHALAAVRRRRLGGVVIEGLPDVHRFDLAERRVGERRHDVLDVHPPDPGRAGRKLWHRVDHIPRVDVREGRAVARFRDNVQVHILLQRQDEVVAQGDLLTLPILALLIHVVVELAAVLRPQMHVRRHIQINYVFSAHHFARRRAAERELCLGGLP